MNQELYTRLIDQGMNEEAASAIAADFSQVTRAKKLPKQTLSTWSDEYVAASAKLRLQAISSLIAVLGLQPSPQMVMEVKNFEPETIEILRRLGALMESKWITMRNTGGKLQELANELNGNKGKKPIVQASEDVDEMLNLVSSVVIPTSEIEESEIKKEEGDLESVDALALAELEDKTDTPETSEMLGMGALPDDFDVSKFY
jgi:hypothetical protein